MSTFSPTAPSRRGILGLGAAAALAFAAMPARRAGAQPAGTASPLKIGVIGSGHIGGTLGALWVHAGHPVMFSSRHPDELKAMAQGLGSLASTGTPEQAAAFGDVILVAIPYRALPQLGRDLAPQLKGKIVLDAGNAVAARDGDMMHAVEQRGIGTVSAEALPGTRLVRAFNSLNWQKLGHDNHRADPIAIPIAGDDPGALRAAETLVRDAGFTPVTVGPLSKAGDFAMGTPMYQATQEEISAAEMRRRFNLAP